ncbi:MAG: ergothioneine biosynthesis protein EgtB [Pirellulales bacterium]
MPEKTSVNASLEAPCNWDGWLDRYRSVRGLTEHLCTPLEVDDYQLQSMAECSPPKWHLAHTTWFFETFVLADHAKTRTPYHPAFALLFNSYYEALGERWPRPRRGLLSRPTVAEIYTYRHAVDEQMAGLLEHASERLLEVVVPLLDLGLHHEQQHQELLLTDLKHAFGLNPLRPSYRLPPGRAGEGGRAARPGTAPLRWTERPAGVRWLGHDGNAFAFDNELPRHRVFVEGHQLASRLTTAGEYRQFIDDGGYRRADLWLSDGWAARQAEGWEAPHYWHRDGGDWAVMTLDGLRPLDPIEPVCHVSYYEADAYARWAAARLPAEAEWEVEAVNRGIAGNFLENWALHPAADGGSGQFFGDVWEWTASPYAAYPGYRPAAGALGEYNAKFMCNQMVLRGGSCVTPQSHIRASYRNFFPPSARWQFSGIRLARDLAA